MTSPTPFLVVLDLDETLIHSTHTPLDYPPAFKVREYCVYLRPGVREFLANLTGFADVAIWSSAGDEYVQLITEQLDPEGDVFKFVWGDSRCTPKRNLATDVVVPIKRLRKVQTKGYHLNRTVIVDDSPEKVRENFGNAIYIPPYTGSAETEVLKRLADFLRTLNQAPNVRQVEKRGWLYH